MNIIERKRRLVLVTPEIAKEWLALSRGNRRTSLLNVAALRVEIQLKRWVHDLGDPIAFDTSGKLVNGHHRLKAIARESAVFCTVEDDMPDEIVARIDQVLSVRIGTDVMAMGGDALAYKRSPILSAILVQSTANHKLTPDAYRYLLAAMGPENVDFVSGVKRQGRGATVRAAFAYCMPALGPKAAPIWAELTASELPPQASTIYKILALPQAGTQAIRRDTFVRTVTALRLLSRGQTSAGRIYAADGALAWADASRTVTLDEMSRELPK